jgi:chemotaxis protein methyltransferase WspC
MTFPAARSGGADDHGIEELLEDWIGLDAGTIGRPAIARAVGERMKALGLADPAAYARRARGDCGERDELVEEVIVAESWFFRDPQVFAHVADVAVTRAALPGRPPIRILCGPAAGGEEPYSVAMALFEAGLQAGQFEIDAIDISRRSLARAAAGRYSANAFRNADSGFRRRWFTMADGQAVLDRRIRDQVRFAWGNLLDPGFAAGRAPYDIVFCRNLLIYLTPAARRQVERQLERLLLADGLLVLGAAEPPIMQGDWIPAGTAALFALRRGIHAPPEKPAGGRPPARPPAPTRPRPAPPGPRPAARPSSPPPPAADLEEVLAEAGRLANEGRLAEAIAVCDRHRPTLPPSPELFFLLGILHQSAGDGDRAESCFHKTLYLDAGHEEALLALALLARQRGDLPMAEQYRQSAARAAARKEERR